MVKIAATIFGIFLGTACWSQTPIPLGDPKAVSIRTAWTDWNPNGECLAFAKTEDSGLSLGLYKLGESQGNVLLHLKKTDLWNLQWFENQDAAIVTVINSGQLEKRGSIFLLDSRLNTAAKLYDQIVPAGENLSFEVAVSPLLEHAIFTIHDGKSSHHVILPPDSTTLVPSTDLDLAEQQGLIGPKWGATGTAFYLDRQEADAYFSESPQTSGSEQDRLLRIIYTAEKNSLSGTKSASSPGQDNSANSLNISIVQSLKDQLTPAPSVGNPGLELMPSNGILRKVRSPGPWQSLNRKRIMTAVDRSPAKVTAGPLVGRSQSLWMMAGDKSWADLVAPSAQNFWLSPTGVSIAYTIDGVLFVRSLEV